MSKKIGKRSALLRLMGYLMKFRWFLLLAIFLAVGSNILALLGPELSGRAIDAATGGIGKVDFPAVFRYAGLMAVFYVISALMTYLLQIVMIHIARNVTFRLRQDLFERLADLPVGFYDSHPAGDILSRISYDADNISESLASDVVHIFTGAITLIGSF